MSVYDFRNLSPIEFEELVGDVLEKELGLRLERFASGRDSGIDLRYARAKRRSLIVQCKHWVESTPDKLTKHLIKQELPKVARLRPRRYILATTLRLSPAAKNKIVAALSPWLHDSGDVLGAGDINALLRKHPEVEKASIKLWLNSSAVLDRALNAEVFNRTSMLLETIERKLKLYVPNPSFARARDILAKLKVAVIAGVPGIGKTMLADMLLLDYVSRGYEPIVISSEMTEAERVISAQPQVFYYDDFLGQTSFAEKLGKNEDARLAQFIAEVRRQDNKRFILTTREYILRQAQHSYEPLSRADLELHKCVIDLSDYTRRTRARILFNHLYHSPLEPEVQAGLLENNQYLRVIDHRNYNPRLIETITDFAAQQSIDATSFPNFVFETLDNPTQIWDHAFRYQLDRVAQLILLALASLPGQVELTDLQTAVVALAGDSRLSASEATRLFLESLKTIETTFVSIEERRFWGPGEERYVTFMNPSIRDFMLGYLRTEPGELRNLLQSCRFFDQVDVLWRYGAARPNASGTEQLPTRTEITEGHWDLAKALRDCFALSVKTERHIPAGRNSYRLAWRGASAEDQLAGVLEILAAHPDIGAEAWACGLIRERRDQWAAEPPSKSEAIHLLRAGNKVCDPTISAELAELEGNTREWFLRTLDDGADFTAFHELNRAAPSIFTSEDVRDALVKFGDYAAGLSARADEEDIDFLASEIAELDEAARAFGVAHHGALEEVRDFVRERGGSGLDDDGDDDPSDSDDDEEAEDADIAAMFDALRKPSD